MTSNRGFCALCFSFSPQCLAHSSRAVPGSVWHSVGTGLRPRHGTSLGTGANCANHRMIPPWKIITSAVSTLHVRLVFPCSNRGGCTWVLIKAFPSLPLQKTGAVSAVSGIQSSCRYLKDFHRKNSPSDDWDQEKTQEKRLEI